MKTVLPLTLLLAVCSPGAGSDLVTTKDLHAPLDALLRKHVEAGRVDYAGLAKDSAKLDAYLARLAVEDVAKLASAGRLAFWLNAYNAFTLKLVLEHYPGLESIRDLEKPWDTRRYRAAGKTWSLNAIEHEVIRKRFDEPRIHFALVCAARSCPDLRSEAYDGDRLEAQLEDATRSFLRDREKGVRIGPSSGGRPTVLLSKLFEWYGSDFGKTDGERLDFLLPRLPEADRTRLAARRAELEIRHLDYDWSLNDR